MDSDDLHDAAIIRYNNFLCEVILRALAFRHYRDTGEISIGPELYDEGQVIFMECRDRVRGNRSLDSKIGVDNGMLLFETALKKALEIVA